MMSHGFGFFLKSLKLIGSDQEVKYLSLAPVFIFIVVLLVGMMGGVFYIDDLVNLILGEYISGLHGIVKTLIYILGFFLFGFFYYVISFVVTSLVSIPVCAKLADKVVVKHTSLRVPETNFGQEVVLFLKMLKAAFAKAFLLIVIGLLLFVCSFIPLLAPLAFFASVFILAFDCTDFVFEKFGYGFRQRLNFLKKNWLAYLGLTCGLCLIVVVPLVQFLVLPVAVCASTLLFSHYKEKV